MFKKSKKFHINKIASQLYISIITQARQECFYKDLGVADTNDGRFDMILLHSFLLFRRLKNTKHDLSREIGQAVFDLMFDDLSNNLREMGIGDIGVSHRIKGMTKAFYGRVKAYDHGLDNHSPMNLEQALIRNLYRKTSPTTDQVNCLCNYVRQENESLRSQLTTNILDGKLVFKTPKIQGN